MVRLVLMKFYNVVFCGLYVFLYCLIYVYLFVQKLMEEFGNFFEFLIFCQNLYIQFKYKKILQNVIKKNEIYNDIVLFIIQLVVV